MKRIEGHLNKGNRLCFDDGFTGKGFCRFHFILEGELHCELLQGKDPF